MTTSVGLDLTADPDPRDSTAAAGVVAPIVSAPGVDGGSWLLMAVPIAICLGLLLYVFLV